MRLKASNRRNQNFISYNGKLITNRKSNADAFKNYFINVGPSLCKQIPKTNSLFPDFLIINLLILYF